MGAIDEWLVVFAILAGSLGLLMALAFFFARTGGWTELSRHFAAAAPPSVERRVFQFIRMGSWIGYNGCIAVWFAPQGLGLALVPRFLPAHPPLLIPWPAIDGEVRTSGFGTFVHLRFAVAPGVEIRVPSAWREPMEQASGGALRLVSPLGGER